MADAREQRFACTLLGNCSGAAGVAVSASVHVEAGAALPQLLLHGRPGGALLHAFALDADAEHSVTGDVTAVLRVRASPKAGDRDAAPAAFIVVALDFADASARDAFLARLAASRRAAGAGPAGPVNSFSTKTDASSADMYFHYYGMLPQQQNMLQDYVRTGTYHAAIAENAADFAGRTVLDCGAGTGILALFAATAGARKVYAVEASGMAAHARALCAGNGAAGARVEVVAGRVEEVVLPERVDVIVSEPMGTCLFNERMCESLLVARDRFLAPGGRLFPALGRLHAAPFADEALVAEVRARGAFWAQTDFYGVDLTPLFADGARAHLVQPVVDAFHPALLLAEPVTRVWDFERCAEADIRDFDLALDWELAPGAAHGDGGDGAPPPPPSAHGVAVWWDVLFDGSVAPRWLSTAPGQPTTHWFCMRFLFAEPAAGAGATRRLRGTMRFRAHARQSFHVSIELEGEEAATAGLVFDMKDCYYRQLTQPQPAGGADPTLDFHSGQAATFAAQMAAIAEQRAAEGWLGTSTGDEDAYTVAAPLRSVLPV